MKTTKQKMLDSPTRPHWRTATRADAALLVALLVTPQRRTIPQAFRHLPHAVASYGRRRRFVKVVDRHDANYAAKAWAFFVAEAERRATFDPMRTPVTADDRFHLDTALVRLVAHRAVTVFAETDVRTGGRSILLALTITGRRLARECHYDWRRFIAAANFAPEVANHPAGP